VIKKEAKSQADKSVIKTKEQINQYSNSKILGNGVVSTDFADTRGELGVIQQECEEQERILVKKSNKEKKSDSAVKSKRTRQRKRTAKWPATLLCPDCGEDIGTAGRGQQHRKDGGMFIKWHQMRHTVEKFTCDCPDLPWVPKRAERVGKNFRLREQHIKMVHWGWKGCSQCIKTFEKVEALAEHEKKHGLTFMCDQCEFVAKSEPKLTQHSHMRHTENPGVAPPSPCPECGKCMSTEAGLKAHRKMAHTSAVCPVCGVTRNLKTLKVHMERMHVVDSEKRFHCEDCGKGFMTNQSIDSHRMNNHIKARPYICRHGCEKRYNDRSNRIAHEKRRHGDSYKLPVET
jgi:hypothetical protein